MKKRTLQSFLMALLVAAFVASCDDSSTGNDDPEPEIEAKTIEDLDGTGENGHFTFFSLRTGEIVDLTDSASTNWDLAFRGTSVLVNSGVSGPGQGGALILDSSFDGVTIAPAEGYAVDTEEVLAIPTGGGNGWYTYTGHETDPKHAILPLPDKTIVVKTADGSHYAKIEMISYYQGNPDTSTEEFADYPNRDLYAENQFYTFRYTIQLEENVRDLN